MKLMTYQIMLKCVKTHESRLLMCFVFLCCFFFSIFFIKAYVVDTCLNCLDNVQIGIHNIYLYKVDKKYTGCYLETT